MKVQQRVIAKYSYQDIIEYQLITSSGFQVNFLNYGGIITAIYTPDKDGKFANIVLAHQQFDPQNPGHLGAITGRIAGRIANASFTLDNTTYKLMANNGQHNLHGGPDGLDKQIWKVELMINGAKLSYTSQHNESGFPSTIKFEVEYLIAENEFQINYYAKPENKTIINLTNHSYFDLSIGKSPLQQQLTLNANYYAEIDKTGIVSGIISPVENTPFDFRNGKNIGEEINANHAQLKLANGYDHPFILTENKQIFLTDIQTGRIMEIITDQPVCVVYSANHYTPKHAGICLETQAIPNAINWESYKNDVIYSADKPYQSYNIWKFRINP